jgi:hypothetical protein
VIFVFKDLASFHHTTITQSVRFLFQRGSDLFLVVHPQKGFVTMRVEQLEQAIRGWAVCGILNLSLTLRELDASLSVAEND